MSEAQRERAEQKPIEFVRAVALAFSEGYRAGYDRGEEGEASDAETAWCRSKASAALSAPSPPEPAKLARYTNEQIEVQRKHCAELQTFLRGKARQTSNLRAATNYAEIAAIIDCYMDAIEASAQPAAPAASEPPPMDQRCAICGQPATCLGQYDGADNPAYACDQCCGHGNEDGRCHLLPTPTPERDARLQCRIIGGRLIVEIGIDTLAFATKESPTLYQRYGYDKEKGEERKDFVTINDPDVWAKEVLRQIEAEAEDGSSLMTKLFDDAIERAIDDGAEGIDIPSIGLVTLDDEE